MPGAYYFTIKIDGVLDDEVWQQPPPEKDFITYYPGYGEKLSQKSSVWMAYDNKNLYFAFLCCDLQPQKIKTSLTKRDQMYDDDWVGISIDALGNKQTQYCFYINPHGIQGDILLSVVSGEDRSPDFIWEIAGKTTPQGYQVEVNQQYPLFYSEKRPFFMEGVDIFNFFTIDEGFLLNPVHTRRIVDPNWGLKITGSAGKTSFGLLAAEDSGSGNKTFFSIARGKYSLGKDNYLGFLFSNRKTSGDHNRVLGVDLGYRFFKNHRINGSFLYSMSGSWEPNSNEIDTANTWDFNFGYFFNSKTWHRKWQDNRRLYRQGDLLNIKQSFFFKASYLWWF